MGISRTGRCILPLSATSEVGLRERVSAMREQLQAQPASPLAETCAAAAKAEAEATGWRLAVAAKTVDELKASLTAFLENQTDYNVFKSQAAITSPPKIGFIFSGQGAEYPGMGYSMYHAEPTFRRAIDRCRELHGNDEPFWPILKEPPAPTSGQKDAGAVVGDDMVTAQLSLFSLQHALVELWKSWGIKPSAVIGFSIGEYAAAQTAGVMDLRNALRLVSARAHMLRKVGREGEMINLYCEEDRLRKAVEGRANPVSISAINAPNNFTISGTHKGVMSAIIALRIMNIETKKPIQLDPTIVPISTAAHSPLLDPFLDEFERGVTDIQLSAPTMPMVSTLTGGYIREAIAKPSHWRRQLREPVSFSSGLMTMVRDNFTQYVEIGPHTSALALAKLNVEGASDDVLIPSLRKGWDHEVVALDALARMYVAGAPVDWAGFYSAPEAK